MDVRTLSIAVDGGARSQAVAISTSNAKSGPLQGPTVLVTVTTSCFVRQGADPTSVVDVDIFLSAPSDGSGAVYRLTDFVSGNKLAFICPAGSSGGTAYLTPGV